MRCEKCGKEIEEERKFCVYCGNPISSQNSKKSFSGSGAFSGDLAKHMDDYDSPNDISKEKLNEDDIDTIRICEN